MTTYTKFAPDAVLNRKDLDIRAGDTVKVHTKIEEKGKTRTQIFQGLVLAVKHGREPGATFTVRKISNGVGVERIFPLYSPNIEKIEIVRRSKVRQSKLYFIRNKVTRDIKRKMRNFLDFIGSTDDLEPFKPEEMMDEEVEVVEATEATEGVEGTEASALADEATEETPSEEFAETEKKEA